MRIFLFLAALGSHQPGTYVEPANPPASVFKMGRGEKGAKSSPRQPAANGEREGGEKDFGVVMWSAAITSVIGCAYTSVSFIRTFSEGLNRNYRYLIIGFIIFSAAVFAFIGKPVKVLDPGRGSERADPSSGAGSTAPGCPEEGHCGGLCPSQIPSGYWLDHLCRHALPGSGDRNEITAQTGGLKRWLKLWIKQRNIFAGSPAAACRGRQR